MTIQAGPPNAEFSKIVIWAVKQIAFVLEKHNFVSDVTGKPNLVNNVSSKF